MPRFSSVTQVWHLPVHAVFVLLVSGIKKIQYERKGPLPPTCGKQLLIDSHDRYNQLC